jgi:pimeloyl-ACP methyl ester carboxylesterase
MKWIGFFALALTTLGCGGEHGGAGGGGGGGSSGNATTDKLRAMGAEPCTLDQGYLCLSLPVPLDHFGAPGGPTIDVTFAVLPAPDATRKGMLVTADGGPGYAGTDDLFRVGTIDHRLAEDFDSVYFDLRGVKTSGDLDCPAAAAAFYLGGLRVADAADEMALSAKSKKFAADCAAETGAPPSHLPFYETAQAVEDLEAFRVAIGETELSLYGLSYGTQFMQTYAQKHGDRVRVLLLDGTVDTSLGHIDYMTDLNLTITDLLDRTLEDCANRAACAADYDNAPGATALDRVRAGYDAVAAALQAGSVTVMFPLKAGGHSKRIFSRADLDTTTFDALYDPEGRGALQRALAPAFKTGDFLPLLELEYKSGGIDGQTAGPIGTAEADPGMSNAIYYAFTCNDYGADAKTAAERQANYLAGGRALWDDPRVLSPYYGDDPCAYWPGVAPAKKAPAPTFAGIPTMIIGATGDGAVPYDQGVAVSKRADDGYLVTVEGGHHVMYGTGNACVDKTATAFLLDLTRPASRASSCPDVFVAH